MIALVFPAFSSNSYGLTKANHLRFLVSVSWSTQYRQPGLLGGSHIGGAFSEEWLVLTRKIAL